LGDLDAWVAVTVESQNAIRVDIEGLLEYILILASQVITQAISGIRNVWECHGSVTECHRFTWVLDILMRHLDVDLEVAGRCTLEASRDVNNERNAAFLLPQ
jgi:hypothetical protein